MLKKGYLASNSIYLSVAHTDQILNSYLDNLNLVFKKIKKCEDGDDIKEMQKLSQSIIPLAAAAYGLYTGDMSNVMTAGSSVALRKEVGKLSNSLISLNNDDRLVNETLMYTPKKLENVFLDEDLIEFSKFYKGQQGYHSWEYKLNFRMFKD